MATASPEIVFANQNDDLISWFLMKKNRRPAILPPGLVAWWRAGRGNANDALWVEANGSLQGGTTFMSHGEVGNSI
jgi:hypothetical protein